MQVLAHCQRTLVDDPAQVGHGAPLVRHRARARKGGSLGPRAATARAGHRGVRMRGSRAQGHRHCLLAISRSAVFGSRSNAKLHHTPHPCCPTMPSRCTLPTSALAA